MNSKDRILNALQRKPVDHPPLWMRFWPLGNENHLPFPWQDQVKRAEYLVGRGVDDVLMLEPPLGYVENYDPASVEGIRIKVQVIPAGGNNDAPLLVKEYETSRGVLCQVIRPDTAWPYGKDIHLFDDLNIPRYVEPVIKTVDDLPSLRCLLGEPSAKQMAQFAQEASILHGRATDLGIAIEGGMTALGDAAVWLCGMQQVMVAQLDNPAFVEQVLDVLVEWELLRLDRLAEAGVDFITHMAWYEGTDFWTPRCFRRLLKPRLARLVERAHAHGLPFRYIITRGWKPIQDDLLELKIDCLAGVDPVQDNIDLQQVRSRLGGQICLMGGVNSAISLSQSSDEQIRQEVTRAVQVLGSGSGFILYPVDAIFTDQAWEKVEVLIDQWKSLW